MDARKASRATSTSVQSVQLGERYSSVAAFAVKGRIACIGSTWLTLSSNGIKSLAFDTDDRRRAGLDIAILAFSVSTGKRAFGSSVFCRGRDRIRAASSSTATGCRACSPVRERPDAVDGRRAWSRRGRGRGTINRKILVALLSVHTRSHRTDFNIGGILGTRVTDGSAYDIVSERGAPGRSSDTLHPARSCSTSTVVAVFRGVAFISDRARRG